MEDENYVSSEQCRVKEFYEDRPDELLRDLRDVIGDDVYITEFIFEVVKADYKILEMYLSYVDDDNDRYPGVASDTENQNNYQVCRRGYLVGTCIVSDDDRQNGSMRHDNDEIFIIESSLKPYVYHEDDVTYEFVIYLEQSNFIKG